MLHLVVANARKRAISCSLEWTPLYQVPLIERYLCRICHSSRAVRRERIARAVGAGRGRHTHTQTESYSESELHSQLPMSPHHGPRYPSGFSNAMAARLTFSRKVCWSKNSCRHHGSFQSKYRGFNRRRRPPGENMGNQGGIWRWHLIASGWHRFLQVSRAIRRKEIVSASEPFVPLSGGTSPKGTRARERECSFSPPISFKSTKAPAALKSSPAWIESSRSVSLVARTNWRKPSWSVLAVGAGGLIMWSVWSDVKFFP